MATLVNYTCKSFIKLTPAQKFCSIYGEGYIQTFCDN